MLLVMSFARERAEFQTLGKFFMAPYPLHNLADDYPPSRPNLATLPIAVALVIGVVGIVAGSMFGV